MTSAKYRIVFTPAAGKELAKLDKPTQRRIQQAVVALESDPRPSGCRKLKGAKDEWRIRVGDHRVIYVVRDAVVLVVVVRVAHRRDAYRP